MIPIPAFSLYAVITLTGPSPHIAECCVEKPEVMKKLYAQFNAPLYGSVDDRDDAQRLCVMGGREEREEMGGNNKGDARIIIEDVVIRITVRRVEEVEMEFFYY